MNFTPEQMSAIQGDHRELLVSAAAGSGKTAVLVERILHMIAQWGYSIDRMLVVTYTRAAAAELRGRLEERMAEAARMDPRLKRQTELVDRAQISTIHAYCQSVVREHFRDCRIDPQFSVGDDRTLRSLYRESMEETLDSVYGQREKDEDLANLLAKYTERELTAMLDALYSFLISRPDPLGWLNQQTNRQWREETVDEEPMAKAFVNEGELALQGVLLMWEQARVMSREPAFPPPLLATLEADYKTIENLITACREGLTAVTTALNQCRFVTLARTKPVTSDETACVESFKELRGKYKKTVDDLRKRLPASIGAALEDMRSMGPALQGLSKAVTLLLQSFGEKKREQATLDFNDLEHFTLELFEAEEIRLGEASRFDAVFVDEYQDVSEIQEAILNGLKRTGPQDRMQRFFYVGDVKQSIYRFRLAEPRLFLEKLETFSSEEDAEKRKIILNRNFRSRTAVLAAVNRTFAHVMDRRVTEIDYNRDAMLYPGVPSVRDPVTELHALYTKGMKPMDVIIREARLIAGDIQRTVGSVVEDAQGNPCGVLHYRDIAILLPVVKNVADKVEAELQRAGVPVYTDAAANAFAGEEVVRATQHLMLLDNLKNDTALISELRGPLFEMSEEELARIRLNKPEREASFLDALQWTAQGQDGLAQRCRDVLDKLERERFLYRSMPPDEYLWDFLMRSGLYAHYGAQPGGKLRMANLRMLCHKAGEYAKDHREGLQGFLESIQTGVGGDNSSPTVINPWEDVVRMMTIHKSKGLEFPTVYVMGLGGGINRRRQSKSLSMHGELGVGLMYRNERARTKRTTLLQSAIDLREAAQERAERARLLYVAMTRPKNRLVMIGSAGSEQAGMEAMLRDYRRRVPGINDVAGVRGASSLLSWLMQCVGPEDFLMETATEEISTNLMWEKGLGKNVLLESTNFPQKTDVWRVFFHIGPEESRDSQSVEKVNSEFSPNLLDFIEKAVKIKDKEKKAAPWTEGNPLWPMPVYEHPPLKLGVTALCLNLEEESKSPHYVEESDSQETVESKRHPIAPQRPRLLGSIAREPSFLTAGGENLAAQRGSATHKLLGALPFEGVRERPTLRALRSYISDELQWMTHQAIFTPREAELADQRAVAAFFLSDTGRRALQAGEAHREWSFNLRIREPVDTIVQGVIDLCFAEDGQWVLVDFKTDRARAAEALWARYERQLSFYRLALERITGMPVKETGLYALGLGEVSFR